MIPTKLSVVEVFTQTKQYAVPLYQRAYVWGREGQWEPFWEDVESIASTLASGKGAVPHFLGAVVLAQHDTHGIEIAKRDVIDGQQRLTTLQVLLAALRDQITEAGEAVKGTPAEESLQDLSDSVAPLTRNKGMMHAPDVERHKVWPTNTDRPVFVSVLTAGSPAALDVRFPPAKKKLKHDPDPRPPLVEAYQYFSTEIRRFCAAHAASPRHPLEAIFRAFQTYLQIVASALGRIDPPPLLRSDPLSDHSRRC
ncbi:MAG: DUF262 domain-containing protein [Deltaproteobacteria bacterium]|nr:DUF262 domain-containing protein [Myxococcales bacterium]MDP3221302.1 DUF262 domain-containing protein [Deltaproteobacteria bacterium]